MRIIVGASLGVVGSFAIALNASAQEPDALSAGTEVRAPASAVEIGVEGGYTQPFGKIGNSAQIGDIAEAGGAVGASVGVRFTPHWALALYGQFHESAVSDRQTGDVDVRGVSAGLVGTYHIRPFKVVDPYVSLGAGYRVLFLARHDGLNETMHAVQAARGIFGVDFRVSEDVAIGPLAGADLDLFVSDKREGAGIESIAGVHPSTFLFAGLAGKFDLGGRRVSDASTLPVAAAVPVPVPRKEQPVPASAVRIEKKILDTCSIATPHAYFEFDSSDVKSTNGSVLNEVVVCFTTGALKGRSMNVVGHADPRGTDAYNVKLGKSRAVAVEGYLIDRGVGAAAVETASHGESEATGEPSAFAFDRRVDITLAD